MKKKRSFAVETWLELLTWTDRRYPMADKMIEYIRMPHYDNFGQTEYHRLQDVSDKIDSLLFQYDGSEEQQKKLKELKIEYKACWQAIANKFRATFNAREAHRASDVPKGQRTRQGPAVGEIGAPQLNFGDSTRMGIAIDIRPTPRPGHHVAEIASIEAIEGKFGPQLKVRFDLGNNTDLTSYFPAKATGKNKTGELLKAALGKLQPLPDSDILIGCKVNVLLEAVEGKDYPAIKSMWPVTTEEQ